MSDATGPEGHPELLEDPLRRRELLRSRRLLAETRRDPPESGVAVADLGGHSDLDRHREGLLDALNCGLTFQRHRHIM